MTRYWPCLPSTTAAGLHAQLPTLTGLHTTDPGELYRHPGRVLNHYRTWIADTSSDDRSAMIVAAPDPGGDDPHRAALWMHIEAITTQALAESDLTLICAYPNNAATADAVRRSTRASLTDRSHPAQTTPQRNSSWPTIPCLHKLS